MARLTILTQDEINTLYAIPVLDQERQHFSRKLKWGPSDFSSEKFAGG
jgi:hypothetical protein